LPHLKVPTSGGSRLKLPLLGLLSRLVSAPLQKPHLVQNEAHTAPQQRYSFLIGSTWPLRTGNTLTLPQSTNQWGLSTQNAPPRSPLSPRERTTSEAAPGPKRSTNGPAAALRHPHRQYLAAEHRKHTYLTSKYQPVGALDSKCPSSVSYFAAIRLRVVCKKAHHTFDYRRRRLPRLGLKHSPYGKNCNNNRDNPVLYGRSQVQRGSQD